MLQTASIGIFNRQKARKVPLPWLRRLAKAALPLCLEAAKPGPLCVLTRLEEIEISLITDKEIARVHGEFLNDPTPTDVITFHHGEILISADTAARQARENKQPFHHETGLYIIHGMLHLAGWDDHDRKEARQMARVQQGILDEILKQRPAR
ncbi:MAG: rRNA maturation RNase YbeY [Verrucomicrobiaceae bacterium]|nr:rRNA maturation RNase YbeY [Verrucomicrobiaceae bacterium]